MMQRVSGSMGAEYARPRPAVCTPVRSKEYSCGHSDSADRNCIVEGKLKGRRVKRYEQLADDLQAQIERGVYRPGERIPSVRQASRQQQLSVTTVLRAYLVLESRGLIESRPQSGYFVRARASAPARPSCTCRRRPPSRRPWT